MKYLPFYLKMCALVFISFALSCDSGAGKKLLVFSKTAGFRHTSIEPGIEALRQLAQKRGYQLTATEDVAYFQEDSLKNFSAVIFLNTTGDVLDYPEQANLERYIQAGGGFVGIHAAADTEYDWPWYGKLVGGYFKSHPKVQQATIRVEDHQHPATAHLPEEWVRTDEWYNYKQMNPEVKVLMSLDESSYEGGEQGEQHPIAWYHEFDGGRAFYTGLGHTEESYSEAEFLAHVWGGIEYAVGNDKRDYRLAKSEQMPLENRFVRTILAQNLDEPMELDALDEDQIIFVERKGAVKLYDLRQDSLYVVAQIPVFTGFEDGLLGIAADPHYAENHWIYMIYSPPGTEAKQHVSRFVFENRKLDMDSEKVLLEIRTQRDQCCHSGGSLEFGPDGLLYISTGDDTNPFASNGFAPIDERPGRKPWDAQRSSANTNDLRGKILRIKPEADGTYSIPEGNLFPPGTPNTRPEIYVMGCRNPFRISIDQKTNFLYWGDVGPDAGKDGENRGPKGYDELNQARHAGFWGWPYTRGDNKAYFDYDFATQTSGERFKPEQLINDSPNNTGLKELPPAQKSFIWYSYDRSEEFPWTATGGKNPMAGPVYYSELFEGVKNRFPDYFNGKLFFYEWMRDWIFIITMDENHNFVKAEPFMQHSSFANPMDMVFGKDGNLYLLEYGEKWFSQNLDARLNKIEYVSGNRAPIARITSDVQVGPAPLTVQFSAAASEDFDQEPLTYSWAFTSAKEQSTALSPSFTFEKEGIYKVQLRVKDPSGQQDVATQEIMVGNSPPEVRIELANANPYYWDNRPLNYKVVVEDAEDGSTEAGTIDMERLKVTLTYIPEGEDLVSAALGHQQQSIPKGKTLIEGSDCKACHALDKKVNGPSYQDIAAKYSLTDTAFLVSKIIQGGSGVWGDNMMSAHPQLSRADVHQMVSYILQLNQAPATAHLLPAAGTIRLTDHIGKESTGKYVLLASYRDKGKGDIASLSAQQIVELKYPRLEAEEAAERSEDTNVFTAANSSLLGNLKDGDYFMFDSLLLDQLQAVELRLFFRRNAHYKGKVEVRLDRPDGPLLGHTQWTYQGSSPAQKTYRIPLKSNSGRHRVYFVFRSLGGADQPGANADYVYLKYRTPNL